MLKALKMIRRSHLLPPLLSGELMEHITPAGMSDNIAHHLSTLKLANMSHAAVYETLQMQASLLLTVAEMPSKEQLVQCA